MVCGSRFWADGLFKGPPSSHIHPHWRRIDRWTEFAANMRSLNSQISVILLFAVLFCEFRLAGGQGKPPSDLFIPVEKGKIVEPSPEQSRRLQRLRDLPTTQSVQVLRVNPAAVLGNELMIPIENDQRLVLSRTGGEVRDPKNISWTGVVRGEQRGSATLVTRNGEITGSINSAQGLYRITPLGEGLYAIIKVDPRRLPPEEPHN